MAHSIPRRVVRMGPGGLELDVDGSGGARDQIDASQDVSRLDPEVPVVQVCPEFGAAIEHTVGSGEDEPRCGVNRCRESTR